MHMVPPDIRLSGSWIRTLLTTDTGERDDTTEVTWLQSDELYVDLRGSVGAVTEGFAGRLVADGPYAHWLRTLDLQPPTATPDQGWLEADGDLMVETGRDGSYVEHWRRTSSLADRVAAVSLRHRDSQAVLVRVGDQVGWALNEATTTEVSLGRITPGGIVVERSSRSGRATLHFSWDADGLVADGRTWSVVHLEGDPDDLVPTSEKGS